MTSDKGGSTAVAARSARTASEAIAERIRSQSASGALRPGDMLPSERVLLETYDVARPTMRGALRILESDGLILVERGTRGGARVVVPDLSPLARRVGLQLQLRGAEFRELFDAQAMILPAAAALAAQVRDEADIARLRTAVRQCLEAPTMRAYLLAVADFGTAVLRASHNRMLELYGELTVAMVTEVLDTYVTSASITFDNADRAIRWADTQFATLVDLIEAGEAERAEAFWREQLAVARSSPWPDPSPFEIYPPQAIRRPGRRTKASG